MTLAAVKLLALDGASSNALNRALRSNAVVDIPTIAGDTDALDLKRSVA